jgi:hypothetical protein
MEYLEKRQIFLSQCLHFDENLDSVEYALLEEKCNKLEKLLDSLNLGAETPQIKQQETKFSFTSTTINFTVTHLKISKFLTQLRTAKLEDS